VTTYPSSRAVGVGTRQRETPPGGQATYDLIEVAPLAWRQRGFRAARGYHTYRFEWQPTQVSFAVDLEDG